MNNALDWWKDS